VKHFISKAPRYELPLACNADEKRRAKRHQLRSRALIGIQGQPSLRGNMIDVSNGGISVSLPVALPAGTECMVFFTIVLEDQLIAVSGHGKITHCICSGDGFRIGMRFSTQDPQAQMALEKLLRE